jgi:outer membrane protein OmpA-like peptidoglycan-associated protein
MKFIFSVMILLCTSIPSSGQSQLVQSIFFEKNSYNINNKYKVAIRNIALQCKSDSFVEIKFYGFTDTVGSATITIICLK